MRKQFLVLLVAVLCPASAMAQIITAPVGNTTLKAADDFASRAFQDPWDMNQKTDVGPFLGSLDAGSSNWTNIVFGNGLFSGTTTSPDAQLWLLDTASPTAAPLGKTGANFPIDMDTYKVLAVRMNRSSGGGQGFVYPWANSIYEWNLELTAGKVTAQGWNVYYVDLSALSGTKRALRFDPAEGKVGESVQVDWARLVAIDQTLCRSITWTGSTTADIYLDNDNDPANGYIGQVQGVAAQTAVASATRSSPGCPVVNNAFNFYVGALAPGTYRVKERE